MKIAIIQIDLPPQAKGGVAYLVHYLANQLVRAGESVVIFTTSPKPKDAEYEIHQIKLPLFIKKIYLLKALIFPVLLAFKSFKGFDILHSHGDNQYIFNKLPTVRTFHGSAFDEAFHSTTIFRFLHQCFCVYPSEVLSGLNADVNTCVSKMVKKRYPFKLKVIYNSVDLNVFKPGEKSPYPVILFVGGVLSGRKRGKMLVEIFNKQIKPKMPKAELWLICKERIKARGVKCFSSELSKDDIAGLYKKAWLLCLPSTYEGFGIPYIEAMASGTAIVTTPNSGAMEVLENGKYGCIANNKHLSEAILDMINNKEKRLCYEKLGLEKVRQFSSEKIFQEYYKIYKRLCKCN